MELTATHLLSIPHCTLQHLAHGDREPLGHGTLSLHLINLPASTKPPASDAKPPGYTVQDPAPGAASAGSEPGTEECLLLSLSSGGPELASGGQSGPAQFELPVAQGTHVVASAGGGYFIPFDGGFDSAGASGGTDAGDGPGFVELSLAKTISLEERDTLEAILSDMTSFIPPAHQPPPLDPSPAEASLRNQLVLMNDAGEVVGTLADEHAVTEDGALFDADHEHAHPHAPVVIESSPSGLKATAWQPVDNPTNSSLISAANFVSSGVVVGSEWAARKMEEAAGRQLAGESRLAGGKHKELVFHPMAGRGAAAGLKVTKGVLTVTGKTVGIISSAAAGVGDRLGRTLGIQSSPSGKPPTGIRGVVNRALVAANSVVDSFELGGSSLLASGSSSANAVIGHHYGPEAAKVSAQVGGSVKHVALVYIDIRGIQRRALLKTVGRSALKAKMTDGTEVVLEPSSKEELNAISGGAGGKKGAGVGMEKGRSAGGTPPPLPARVGTPGGSEKGGAPALPPRGTSPPPPPPIPARPTKN